MAYTAWSVTFGEQPTAAKWNQLGTNDASFNDGTGIANGVIASEKLNATIAFKAYRNAAANVTGGGGAAKLALDAEAYDLGGDFDLATNRFDVPVTGYYFIHAQFATAATDGATVLVEIRKNGAESARNLIRSGASGTIKISVSDVMAATAGDYVEMWVDNTNTEAITVGVTETFMTGYFIGV